MSEKLSDGMNPLKGESASADDEEQAKMSDAFSPDALAVDGVLSLLQSGKPRPRSLSKTTKRVMSLQDQQLRFNDNRRSLEHWLTMMYEAVSELRQFCSNNRVQFPRKDELSLKVLELDIKIGSNSLSKETYESSVTSILDARLILVLKHILKLRERIQDTTSKVLVTGDLNAGKSSLCNALLRRDVLPVDQQPCTDVFCEVVDAKKNDGKEELHAVYVDSSYEHENLATYKVFPLEEIKNLVRQSSTYSLIKVYLLDNRDPELSLLSNGVVDICLIDAPGLNVDTKLTMELFGRQEEIDLVVFVVSAANHFTQSAKEFLNDASREKSRVFIVVNHFDQIKDKERCRNGIMSQLQSIAPETYKLSDDFVHFVASNPEDGSGSGGDPSDPEDIRYNPNSPDFDRLEASLRNFVMEKRSVSKLEPARTYLKNLLQDLIGISRINIDMAIKHQEEVTKQLDEISPNIENMVLKCAAVTEQIHKDLERLAMSLEKETSEYLSTIVDKVGDRPMVKYNGFLDVVNYARQTREALITRIQTAVVESEENAREVTASAVDAIKSLGILHVGEQPVFSKIFQKSAMFSRKRDNLTRAIRAPLSLSDFIDLGGLLQQPLPVMGASKQALASNARSISSILTLFSVVGGSQLALSSPALRAALAAAGWLDWRFLRKLIPSILGVAVIGIGLYIINEMPRTIPRRIARRIAFEIDRMGYVQANSYRIASECRKVLRYPASDVRVAFQSKIDAAIREREKYQIMSEQSKAISTFFLDILKRSEKMVEEVDACNLDFSLD